MGELADYYMDRDLDRFNDEAAEFENTGTCQRCGARIDFIHSGVRWRLFEVGSVKLHVCANQASADEFPAGG
ncbi:hypothetical protein UFOVP61_25 [uncultured Caudovirales phage]|uniref:Uncharacterized protein n=1 Tax=uncultured Caudovirales phage TaxID=2100421 RepID=A0A6J5KUP5_9CAUD|nr:hypothetical protein UFOVP61_25 [uncultured Caudovirales phage]